VFLWAHCGHWAWSVYNLNPPTTLQLEHPTINTHPDHFFSVFSTVESLGNELWDGGTIW
jgi:hypothetical protein